MIVVLSVDNYKCGCAAKPGSISDKLKWSECIPLEVD